MRIRGHHLICSQKFQGLGYDQRFVRVFKEIIYTWKVNPRINISVLASPDIICAACPNRRGQACFAGGKNSELGVREMDNQVIKLLAVNRNDLIPLPDILVKLVEQKEALQEICSSCPWYKNGICRKMSEREYI